MWLFGVEWAHMEEENKKTEAEAEAEKKAQSKAKAMFWGFLDRKSVV